MSPERVYTRPLIDKLGVTPGARVALLGVDDPDFLSALRDRTHDITHGLPLPTTDLVFLAADSHEELSVIVELRRSLKPAGAIWVVSKKGRASTLRDVEIMAAARAAGLVDNKVVAFSPTNTSMRLVIPIALR
ncbi:MAG: DUF3052 family protein [Candidatus Limnocylindrales bacterium]